MSPLRILCGSYNVNATDPDESLADWLCRSAEPPHIVALAMQEIVDLSHMSNYLTPEGSKDAAYRWAEATLKTLRKHRAYSHVGFRLLVRPQVLVGVCLIVIVQSGVSRLIADVQTAEASSGALLGYIGNKGACAMRMRVCCSGLQRGESGITLCFVASHLSAHQSEVERRNADVQMIMDKIQFPLMAGAPKRHHKKGFRSRSSLPVVGVSLLGGEDISEGYDEEDDDAVYHAGLAYHSVLESHAIFWMGDLNYRVDNFTWQEAHAAVSECRLTELLSRDQLTVSRASGLVFMGFREGVVTFPPTYKFEPGTSHYDKRADKKIRVPSWCDRILYRAQTPIAQDSYYSCTSVVLSDHKPVGSHFTLSSENVGCNLDRISSADEEPSVKHDETATLENETPAVIDATSAISTATPATTLPRLTRARYTFNARTQDEISFESGDFVQLLSLNGPDPGWSVGCVCDHNGANPGPAGYFPHTFIEDHTMAAAPTVAKETTVRRHNSPLVQKKAAASGQRTAAAAHHQRPLRAAPLPPSFDEVRRPQGRAEASSPKDMGLNIASTVGETPQPSASSFKATSILQARDSSTESRGVQLPPHKPRSNFVVAKFSYTARAEDELSFVNGESIEVVSRSTLRDNWWRGRIGNRTGMFPANFVRDPEMATEILSRSSSEDRREIIFTPNQLVYGVTKSPATPQTKRRSQTHVPRTSRPPPPPLPDAEPDYRRRAASAQSSTGGGSLRKHGSFEHIGAAALEGTNKGAGRRRRGSKLKKDDAWRLDRKADGDGQKDRSPPKAGTVLDGGHIVF